MIRIDSGIIRELKPGEVTLHAPSLDGVIYTDFLEGTNDIETVLRVSVTPSEVTIARDDGRELDVWALDDQALEGDDETIEKWLTPHYARRVFTCPVAKLVLNRLVDEREVECLVSEEEGLGVEFEDGFKDFIARTAIFAAKKQAEAKSRTK